MTSMRENPIRRQVRTRPPWLIAVLIAVAVLVVVGVVYGAFTLIRGGGSSASGDQPSGEPSPCATTMVTPIDVLPKAADVSVNVYNATGTTGLAGKTAKELGARDFKVVKVANDPRSKKIKGVAQIRFGPRGEPSARVLLFQVPGAEMVNDGRKGKVVDLAMGETFNGLSPLAGVTTLMAQPTPSVSGIGCPSSSS